MQQTRKRTYGTGSVTLTRGRYLARLPGKARTILGTYDSEQEAHSALDRALGLVSASLTVGDFLRTFVEQRELSGRVRDISREWVSVNKWVLPFTIATIELPYVTRRLVQAWVDEIRQHLSAQSVRHAKRILSQAFEEAVAERIIPSNPCRGVRIKPDERGKVVTPYLTQAEIQTLLADPKLTEQQRAVFAVAICTGLRQGEIFGLRREDVHLEAKHPYLNVKRSWDQAPKNGRADQRVYLIPLVAPLLQGWLDSHDGDLVFPAPGDRMRYRRYDSGWTKVRDRLGLNPDVTFHGLRKTAGTALLAGWLGPKVSPLVVSKTLRHATLKQTLDTYAFLLEEDLAAALNQNDDSGCEVVTLTEENLSESGGLKRTRTPNPRLRRSEKSQ